MNNWQRSVSKPTLSSNGKGIINRCEKGRREGLEDAVTVPISKYA